MIDLWVWWLFVCVVGDERFWWVLRVWCGRCKVSDLVVCFVGWVVRDFQMRVWGDEVLERVR